MVVLAVGLTIGWRAVFAAKLTVSFVVPDAYTGYLVTRWECPGGMRLAKSWYGGWQELEVIFANDGTACIADSIPAGGFRVGGFRYANGEKAPVIVGGTRGVQGNRPVGEHELVVSPYASLGIGNGQILGDECTFNAFLAERFSETVRRNEQPCDPIYVLADPAIPLTPGMKAGP